MRHAVESIRNRKSTTGQNNHEFIQSLKIQHNNSGNFQAAAAQKSSSIKRTPSNDSSFISKNQHDSTK